MAKDGGWKFQNLSTMDTESETLKEDATSIRNKLGSEELGISEAVDVPVLAMKRKVSTDDDPLEGSFSKRVKVEKCEEESVEKGEEPSTATEDDKESGVRHSPAECGDMKVFDKSVDEAAEEHSAGNSVNEEKIDTKSGVTVNKDIATEIGDVSEVQKKEFEVPKETFETKAEEGHNQEHRERVEEKDDHASAKEEIETPTRRYLTRSRSGVDTDTTVQDEIKASDSSPEGRTPAVEVSNSNGSVEREHAASVGSDSGSDKENISSSTPVELSNGGTPDVIMLSDEEESNEQNRQGSDKMFKNKRCIRRLQSELRNEEAKLVLLKKLRQSQQAPPAPEHPVPNNANNIQPVKPSVPRQTVAPPPLVRVLGAQPVRTPHLQPPQNRLVTQGALRGIQGPTPLVGAQRGNTNTSNGLASQSIRGAAPLSSANQRTVQQQQTPPVPKAATPPQPPVDTQTPAQRQAAAKLALRKQLEKTLLQIPPPKPPAPEMNFIPSLACPDFVLLLGLEEVVNHIIDLQLIARGQKSADEKFICNPFTCVQCGTDYTPVWKREKPGSKNVICEHCVTWNQKRALKQEHTNRLKSAFVKALQQEQEIERMQAPTTTASTSPAHPPTPPAPSSTAPPLALAAAQAVSNVAAAMSLNSASFRANAEQLRQQQNFLQQAHQAQLRASQPLAGLQAGFGSRGTFPYSLPFVKQADLQRHQQYLLDMIPRANMSWKH